jgi:hypothetical protein
MPRIFSKDQFQSGSTIDGNRIDRLIGALVARYNALTQGDREHRWFERTIHSSFHASANATNHPWEAVTRVATTPPDWMVNPIKWKGYASNGLALGLPAGLVGTATHVAWATSAASSKVSRLRRITVMALQIPSVASEAAGWQFGAAPVPPGSNANDFINDITIEVLVMSPFAVERRQEASVVLLREQFRASAHLIYPFTPIPAPAAQMAPLMPVGTGYSTGLCIDIETDIPIPAFGRIVSGIILPNYTGTIYNTPWTNGEPWDSAGWSHTMVLQERA